MSEKNTGGSAFPWRDPNDVFNYDRGMTLRDYFAAKALQGLIASPTNTRVDGVSTRDSVSKVAYILADAMLEARDA